MASDASFVEYVIEQSRLGASLATRKMFGEYALYLGGKVVGFVCDNQLFLKPTDAGRAWLGTVTDGFPYPGAKPHFLITDTLDEPDRLQRLLVITADALPAPKPKASPATRGARKPAVGG